MRIDVLDDGTPVTLRHIRPDDAAELRGFDRLSPSSRYRRFMGGMHSLSDETLRYLTCVDCRDHVAIVAVTRAPGAEAETGLGIARFIRTADDPTVAEAAITVIDDVQGKGLGRIWESPWPARPSSAAFDASGRNPRQHEPVRQLLDEVGGIVRRSDDASLVFDIELGPAESPDARHRFDTVARRLLRAASSHLVGLIPGARSAVFALTLCPRMREDAFLAGVSRGAPSACRP